MAEPLFISVDLGAGSGRVFLYGFDPSGPLIEELTRFKYPPYEKNGRLLWNFDLIFENIINGLRAAARRAQTLGRSVLSLGIDSWAVDYGCIGFDGKLISDPVAYRDQGSVAAISAVNKLVELSEIFDRTGIQFQPFNTVFRVFSEGSAPDVAQRLLLPDLINHRLTGKARTEYTNATTTQMVNVETRDWDGHLLERLGMSRHRFPAIVPHGTDLGPLLPDMEENVGLSGVRVIIPATHDTASAIASAPLKEGTAYISSGTWSLIGVEVKSPVVNDDVRRHNFTNEGGVFGTYRFLKNVMGLWIFESCLKEWREQGLNLTYEGLTTEIEQIDEPGTLIFPDDESFLNPPSMLSAIRRQLLLTGQEYDERPVFVSKMIFDSLAFRYASVLGTTGSLTGITLSDIQILGGGSRNRYLNRMTADASGLPTRSGLPEASALGNALVQAIAYGRFSSIDDARRYVERTNIFETYSPAGSQALDAARTRYLEIEAQFLES